MAIRLTGQTPDGVFEGGQVTIDLTSEATRRYEAYIGYNSALGANQANLVASHWHGVRALITSIQGQNLGTNASGTPNFSITQGNLSGIHANPDLTNDTDAEAQHRAGILIESASLLIDLFGRNTCASGPLPVFAATPAQIRAERNHLQTMVSMYIRMGGEADDGGVPDGSLSGAVTLDDASLQAIDALVGYRPADAAAPASADPDNPVETDARNELQRNWQAVRALVVSLRNEAGVIDQAKLNEITDSAARERAAVQINTLVGMLRIMRTENWRAGRAFNDAGIVTLTANPASLTIPTADGGVGTGVIIPANPARALTADMQVWSMDGATPTRITGATVDPANGVTIPFANVPAGAHSIQVRMADGTTVVANASFTTTAAAPVVADAGGGGSATVLPDAGAPRPAPTGSATVLTDAGRPDTGGTGGTGGANSSNGGNGPSTGTVFAAVFGGIATVLGLRFGIPALISWARNRGTTAAVAPRPATTGGTPGATDGADDLLRAAEAEARRVLAAGAQQPPQGGTGSQPPTVVNATNFLDATPADQLQVVTPQEQVVEAQIKSMYSWARDSHNAGTVRAMARVAIQQLQSNSRPAGLPTESHLDMLREERLAAERAGIREGTVRAGVPERFLRAVVEQQVTGNALVMNQLGFGSAADFSRIDAEARTLIENRRAEYHRAMEGFLPRP